MRHFSLGKKFNLIFIPFNSIQNTYHREDLEKIFFCVKEHLAPQGIFALDIFNPNLDCLVQKKSSKPCQMALDMRCFFPEEINALLYYNGFDVISKFGTFQKDAFSADSPKQIIVCQRREVP
jgi:hypothetical protein